MLDLSNILTKKIKLFKSYYNRFYELTYMNKAEINFAKYGEQTQQLRIVRFVYNITTPRVRVTHYTKRYFPTSSYCKLKSLEVARDPKHFSLLVFLCFDVELIHAILQIKSVKVK